MATMRIELLGRGGLLDSFDCEETEISKKLSEKVREWTLYEGDSIRIKHHEDARGD